MSNPPSAQELLVNLINEVNTQQWSPSELVFAAPVALTGQTCNTSVAVTAAAGQPYSGSVTIRYNRVNLASVPGANSTTFPLEEGYLNTVDLIPAIVERYGINLSSNDIVAEALPEPDEDGDVIIAILANPTSLLWRGAFGITLSSAPIGNAFNETELGGLTLGNLQGGSN